MNEELAQGPAYFKRSVNEWVLSFFPLVVKQQGRQLIWEGWFSQQFSPFVFPFCKVISSTLSRVSGIAHSIGSKSTL